MMSNNDNLTVNEGTKDDDETVSIENRQYTNKSVSSSDSLTSSSLYNANACTSAVASSNDSLMESFLEHARYGNLNTIKEIVDADKSFNVNYRGKH